MSREGTEGAGTVSAATMACVGTLQEWDEQVCDSGSSLRLSVEGGSEEGKKSREGAEEKVEGLRDIFW